MKMYVVCSKSFGTIFYIFSDMPATELALSPSKYLLPALIHRSQRRCHFWKQLWYAFWDRA
jgi:hypothetical protein